jgi:small-conductance mechanosensitive channel
MSQIEQIIERAGTGLVEQLGSTAPDLILGLVFLTVAYPAVRIVLFVARRSLRQLYRDDQRLIADLGGTLLSIGLWFAVVLTFLKIVGMGDIAVSLGTATGFIALGVAYALSEMIEDTVAGIYLLRDPDFNVGDTVSTDKVAGTVAAIELRKSRIETPDGDRVIVANRDIESRWTHSPDAQTENSG